MLTIIFSFCYGCYPYFDFESTSQWVCLSCPTPSIIYTYSGFYLHQCHGRMHSMILEKWLSLKEDISILRPREDHNQLATWGKWPWQQYDILNLFLIKPFCVNLMQCLQWNQLYWEHDKQASITHCHYLKILINFPVRIYAPLTNFG